MYSDNNMLTDKFKPDKKAMNNEQLNYKKSIWLLVLICLVTIVLSSVGMHFIDSVYYNTLIINQSSQISALKNRQSRFQMDIKYITDSLPTSLNCIQLQTAYAMNVCHSHNANLKK